MKLVPIDKTNLRLAILLAKEIFPSEQHETFWPEDAYRDCIANPERQWLYYIAYEQYCAGRASPFPVGITGHYVDTDGYLWIGWFGIVPEHRGHGHAIRLLSKTLDIARKFGRKKVRLYTLCSNTAAINLYFKCGFKIIGKPRDMGDRPNSLSHVMEVTL